MQLHIYIAKARKATHTTFYLEPYERRQLYQEAGANGVLMFEYLLYMAKYKSNDQAITDKRTAEWFGWTEATARRYRLALIKKGWLLIQKFRKDGNVIATYHLGKEAVAAATAGPDAGTASQAQS